MQTKEFHLGDVLSITTDYFASPRYMDGIRDILNFMTGAELGDELFDYQLPRARKACRQHLLEQFPQFAELEMDPAIAEIRETIRVAGESNESWDETKTLVASWLAKQVARYGETFVVRPLPEGVYIKLNPIMEAALIIGNSKRSASVN